jgi:hypothetical protein
VSYCEAMWIELFVVVFTVLALGVSFAGGYFTGRRKEEEAIADKFTSAISDLLTSGTLRNPAYTVYTYNISDGTFEIPVQLGDNKD